MFGAEIQCCRFSPFSSNDAQKIVLNFEIFWFHCLIRTPSELVLTVLHQCAIPFPKPKIGSAPFMHLDSTPCYNSSLLFTIRLILNQSHRIPIEFFKSCACAQLTASGDGSRREKQRGCGVEGVVTFCRVNDITARLFALLFSLTGGSENTLPTRIQTFASDMIWQNVKAAPSPVKRHGACMASVDGRLLLFGGRSSGLCSCQEIHMCATLLLRCIFVTICACMIPTSVSAKANGRCCVRRAVPPPEPQLKYANCPVRYC